MNDEDKSGRSPLVSRRRAALGYDARSERRALRGQARRRKLRTRLWLVAVPTAVVIAVVVTVLVAFGGPGSGGGAEETSTTAVGPGLQTDLLVIQENGAVPVMVLLETRDGGGLVLAMPGTTLLKSADGFKILSDIYTSGEEGALAATLAEVFGAQVRAVASVSWSVLRSALVDAGAANAPSATLTYADGEAGQVARAVMAAIRESDPVKSAAIWAGLDLTGDSSGFRAAVSGAASSPAGGQWVATVLTGRMVEGETFKYLEPEVERVKALLAGATEESTVSVEVQNGSGVVGIAERAAAQLGPLGYTVVPSGNSDDFPGVGETRIMVSSNTAAAGAQVRATLGVGTVTEDETLEVDHLIVVLGKDYVPPASTSTGSTG